MNEKDWAFLAALAAQKSLTGAAQALYITQPAATRRLQQIEAELGCALLIRSRSGGELTAEGEAAAQYAVDELARLDDLHRTIAERGSEPRGTVRLGCANAYALSCLPALLKSFAARCPRVDLRVVTGTSGTTARRLLAGEVHAAIIRGTFDWPEARLELNADPWYYLASAKPIELEHLPELPQIHVSTDAPLQAELDRWWTERFRTPPRVVTNVDRTDVGIEMVRQGLGYAFFSGLYLQNQPRLRLQKITFANRELRRDTRAYVRESTLEIRAVRAFWDYLSENTGHNTE